MSRPLKILVVDDEPTITKLIGAILRARGYDVIEVNDPRKVEEYLLYTELSLVITDLFMPHLDGMELLNILKQSKPELPVIILTGHGTIDSAVEATRSGAAEYLTKPINKDMLLKAVRQHVTVDAGLTADFKDFVSRQPIDLAREMAAEPDKMLLENEILSTETVPDGFVEVRLGNIMPG